MSDKTYDISDTMDNGMIDTNTLKHLEDLLRDRLPCPHCGSTNLRVAYWAEDTDYVDAIECSNCLAAAPATVWDQRT